jgi:hypothetical protein
LLDDERDDAGGDGDHHQLQAATLLGRLGFGFEQLDRARELDRRVADLVVELLVLDGLRSRQPRDALPGIARLAGRGAQVLLHLVVLDELPEDG